MEKLTDAEQIIVFIDTETITAEELQEGDLYESKDERISTQNS